ncbi:short-chain dehydrogenase TIC 32, chloroplastic-like [Triticum dicoccoides]|uniref:short-chain dehydrogenase TIC 32, chloroplastic-like n=1 Tax=Triticum dicoccoides TaxID=85692 RepID=UPI00188F2440|nr:short-chain dehydrogenase TIC 32, chloroplastic-like [Triticum dicoccoides]
MAIRNLAAAEDVRQAVLAESPAASLDLMELDLSSLASVRKFVGDIDATGLPLNILVLEGDYTQGSSVVRVSRGPGCG